MNYSQAFQLVNLLAMLTWLLLIFFPRMKYTKRIAFGFTIFILSIVYSWMVFSTFQMDDFKEFSSLKGLMSLFQKEQAVLLGWIHYLAFDLMAGLYILENGQKSNIKHLLLVPCLGFTFIFGPAGLLMYRIIRYVHQKNLLDY
jgi:hypothetical protein